MLSRLLRSALGNLVGNKMNELEVVVQQGKLKGKTGTDYIGNTFYSFQGIPYAKPPIGNLRFKAPQPPESWEGVWDATYERDECFGRHMVFQTHIGSEDCLHLNVFTPEINQDVLRPVMVWIHGGGFTAGSSKTEIYGPEFLVAQDIVLVTINYRHGVLGFLSLEDTSLGVPGNAGLKDQVQALKWVQNNIRSFSGDPDNVTIFGESAGAASVHYLILSPLAKGLFHKAILQSGCALNYWTRGRTDNGIPLAKLLGHDPKSEAEALEYLREADLKDLLTAQERLPDPFPHNAQRAVGPVVEKPSNEATFLSQEPLDILVSGDYNKVPLVFGYNDREGMLIDIVNKRLGKQTVANIDTAVPYALGLERDSPEWQDLVQRIKEFYYGNEEPTEENIDNYIVLESDNGFIRGIHSTIRNHLPTSNVPIYLYRFTVDAGLNLFKKMAQIDRKGAGHADELGYLFKNMLTPEIQPGSVEDVTIRRMTKLWATFAKYGDPNPKEKDSLVDVVWKPIASEKEVHFFEIGENLSTGINPESERMAFWDSVFNKATGLTSKL